MKTIEQIKDSKKLLFGNETFDGASGEIHLYRWTGTFVVSWGGGWEHVSVSPYKKNIIPSWEEMCQIKDMFWNDDEAVIQVHPPKEEYVNLKENCLHLWRCTYKEMVLPPSIFVGVRRGQTRQEIHKELVEAYEIAGERFE